MFHFRFKGQRTAASLLDSTIRLEWLRGYNRKAAVVRGGCDGIGAHPVGARDKGSVAGAQPGAGSTGDFLLLDVGPGGDL
jgi:hypothetical protein